MTSSYRLTQDPLFYVTAALFALLTTSLPAFLGQAALLPVLQALGLTIFAGVALRQEGPATALKLMGLWLGVQFLTLLVVTLIRPGAAEQALGDGFAYRASYVQWFFTGQGLPHAVTAEPLGRLAQLAGIVLGSLLTGGLVGAWFLAKAVNQFAFSVGVLAEELGGMGVIAGLTPWSLLTLAGYAGLVVLLAEPIVNNIWDVGHFLDQRRRLLVTSLALLLAGLLLELVLPGAWSRTFRP